MDLNGEAGSVNQAVPLDDLSLGTIIALIGRLKETETASQMVCRELELDDAYRRADMDVKEAVGDSSPAVAELERIRQLVITAHDFVGESKIEDAVQELNKVVEMKIGL